MIGLNATATAALGNTTHGIFLGGFARTNTVGGVGAGEANTIAFNGSYFNTNRMVKQYTRNAYYPVQLTEFAKVEEEVFAD